MADTHEKNIVLNSEKREKRLIVVVDGDSAHLYYMSILLQRLEYNIRTAKTAEDALEIMNVAQPALILTEVSLDGMDGIELLKRLKRNPQSYTVKRPDHQDHLSAGRVCCLLGKAGGARWAIHGQYRKRRNRNPANI